MTEDPNMGLGTEELMWRKIYRQLQKQKSTTDLTPHEESIRETDGGFFERFGTLFQEYAAVQDTEEKKKAKEKKKVTLPNVAEVSDEDDTSSIEEGVELVEDSDDTMLMAMNINELYTSVLYEILHSIGFDVDHTLSKESLITFAKEAFRIGEDVHRALLETARTQPPPKLLLNVQVIEARDLSPKDSNGLSDPFVTIYLSSNMAHRYNTSVKMATLTPIWQEHFALPMAENSTNDILCLEVWDFDPAETVKEKFVKLPEVKGVKGMRKLIKEIAFAATAGQHENELIGIAEIPLNMIPSAGITMWYDLHKRKNTASRKGVIKLKLAFGSEKNSMFAAYQYMHVLKIILLHTLENSAFPAHSWHNHFSEAANVLLGQHVAQSGLDCRKIALCQFSVFASTHQNHPLSFTLFSNLLNDLVKQIEAKSFEDSELLLFWNALRKLLPTCFQVVRKLRSAKVEDESIRVQITEVLFIISQVAKLQVPQSEDFSLFPSELYPWLRNYELGNDVSEMLGCVVNYGAEHWISSTLRKSVRSTGVQVLEELLLLVQTVKDDLSKAAEYLEHPFQEILNYPYVQQLYTVYQAKISVMAEPNIRDICRTQKKLSYTEYTSKNKDATDLLLEGTKLFEVYLSLHRFCTLGKTLCPEDKGMFHIENFYKWFHDGVTQWLDIAVFKALQRIEKAIELDALVHVDDSVKYSSSAVDSLTIFYQVKIFWQQLNWPNPESCYAFIAKIIDDICRCCVFYTSKISERLERIQEDKKNTKSTTTTKWCLAVNNMEYIRQALQPLALDLGMKTVIDKLAMIKSPMEAERCQATLNTVMENSMDTMRNNIIGLLESIVKKIEPTLTEMLTEGAEIFTEQRNKVDKYMLCIDEYLQSLHAELNQENFTKVLEILWDSVAIILQKIIDANLDKRRPGTFYNNLNETVNLLTASFKSDEYFNSESLQKSKKLLDIHGMDTDSLIHRVHLDMYTDFKGLQESKYGMLTVKAKIYEYTLSIQVMNARNLFPMDSNGSCDPFVKIHLLPEHHFKGNSTFKTHTHNKTLFPLYDENFVISLPNNYKSLNGLILFSIKDKDLLGYNNQYVGEAFVHFDEITETNQSMDELSQIHLYLGRPSNLNTDPLMALESRSGDKQAKEFLRRYKQKLSATTN